MPSSGRSPPRLAVEIDENRRDHDCDQEKQQDPVGAVLDVADDLREPDDVNADVVGFELAPDVFLEAPRDFEVIEFFLGVRIEFQECRADERAGEIVGDQPAHEAGLENVLADFLEDFRFRLEIGRDDRAALNAVFHDLQVAGIGREQRRHPRPVHAGDEEYGVGGLLQRLEELRIEHVAVFGDQRHEDPVSAPELVEVLDEGLHVLVLQRQLLRESGIDAQLGRGRVSQKQGNEQEDADDDRLVVENEGLDALHEA